MYDPKAVRDRQGGEKPQANLFPIGKHIAQVTDHEIGETSGGYGQVIVTFGNPEGQSRKAWLIFEGPADFQLDSLLKAVGWDEPLDVHDVQQFRDACYDKDVEIVVKSERFMGEDKVKVKYINKAPRGTGQPPRTPADGFASGHSAAPPQGNPDDDVAPF